jgi:hypothetical protein
MPDDSLSPEERAALDRLPRAAAPPPHLEDRVVAALHRAGRLRPRRARPAWLRLAAAIALVSGGLVLGRLTMPTAPAPADSAYLLLLYGGDAPIGAEPGRVAEYAAWAGTLRQRQQLIVAERLTPDARVLGQPTPGGAGPVGFFLIRADTLDAAAATAASCPHLKYGGTVVVRPVG